MNDSLPPNNTDFINEHIFTTKEVAEEVKTATRRIKSGKTILVDNFHFYT